MIEKCKGCKHHDEKRVYDDFYEAEFIEDICLKGHNLLPFLPFLNCKYREEEGEENDKN